MTTLDTLNLEALYVPGMRFWRNHLDVRVGVIAQNANGAVEIWHAGKDTDVGQVLAHSHTTREGYEESLECTILGGTCYSKGSFIAYGTDFRPLLFAHVDAAVLQLLADWHDQCFAGTRVTAS